MSSGVAIIGSGIFARSEHLPAVQQTPQLVLRAIYSRSLASARNLASGTNNVELYSEDSGAGKSYDDLLKRSDIQAVIIALPIEVQPNFIKAALSAGKHVFSEKPVAADMAGAQALIEWYRRSIDTKQITWGVAENWRFQDSLLYARQEVEKLGKLLGIRVTKLTKIQPGEKYYETAWRKTPSYQGGFILDGGVHYVAATRLLLGESNPIVRVSALTTQLQSHLPPVDTLDAVLKTKSGISGSLNFSFGTTFTRSEYCVACEKGTVVVSKSKVTVKEGEGKDAKERVKEFSDEGSGVKQEVRAWAEGILAGKQDPRQTPEEALKDLEVLEKMLRSGESNGMPQDISL